MGLEPSDELIRITKIKACHILSSDAEYKRKCMFDSVKEQKSKIHERQASKLKEIVDKISH